MKTLEKMSVWIRHLPLLEHAEWLWNPVRPIYQRAVSHFGENGLERLVNGSDRILVSPRARDVPEKYEPNVWRALMAELKCEFGAQLCQNFLSRSGNQFGTNRLYD